MREVLYLHAAIIFLHAYNSALEESMSNYRQMRQLKSKTLVLDSVTLLNLNGLSPFYGSDRVRIKCSPYSVIPEREDVIVSPVWEEREMSTYKSLGHSIAKNGEKMTHEETAVELNLLKNRLNQLEAEESEIRSESANGAKFAWLRTPWFVAGALAILVIVMIGNTADITVGDVAGAIFAIAKAIAVLGMWVVGSVVGLAIIVAIIYYAVRQGLKWWRNRPSKEERQRARKERGLASVRQDSQ